MTETRETVSFDQVVFLSDMTGYEIALSNLQEHKVDTEDRKAAFKILLDKISEVAPPGEYHALEAMKDRMEARSVVSI